jgi:hypothetical protein
MDAHSMTNSMITHVIGAIDAAPAYETPFYHLQLKEVFPGGIYAEMMEALPAVSHYRALPGRNNENLRDDGSSTRVKIDLFPEYIRHLPAAKRRIWDLVGDALRSPEVCAAFMRRLAPALERRFGAGHSGVGMYPIPVLTRDIPGYCITPHTDTRWKGITVQLYLPRDEAHPDIGTIFHGRAADGSFTRDTQMRFGPNSGYAFAVGDDSWHSADPVPNDVVTRDSILLTYFVDAGVLRFLRNRGKRVGNFVLNEARYITRR